MEKVRSFLLSKTGNIVMIAVLYMIFLAIMVESIDLIDKFPAVSFAFALAIAFCGWKSLTRITPSIFLVLPIVGWIIYFVIKGFLSVIVGSFTAPLFIAKKFTKAIRGVV